MTTVEVKETAVLTPDTLLAHWQGHRRLTRRVMAAFPDDQLFAFSAGGMRSFGSMAWEIVGVTEYTLQGLVTDEWPQPIWAEQPQEKDALLAAWDDLTARLDADLPGVPGQRYGEVKALFWGDMPAFAMTVYTVDNEIHHRGQGYVYLRLLGVEPPQFWER